MRSSQNFNEKYQVFQGVLHIKRYQNIQVFVLSNIKCIINISNRKIKDSSGRYLLYFARLLFSFPKKAQIFVI